MDKKALDTALGSIPYGLYVLGSINGPTVSAVVVNWVTQVSFNPPLIAVAVEARSRMQKHIQESHYFSVNILPKGGTDTAEAFVRQVPPIGNAINGKEFTSSKQGLPFLRDAVASLECKVKELHQAGDHIIFIGEVTDATSNKETDALTLKETGWKYREKGRSHKS